MYYLKKRINKYISIYYIYVIKYKKNYLYFWKNKFKEKPSLNIKKKKLFNTSYLNHI